jgi:hypothetical protein
MKWAILLFIFAIVVVHWWDYRRAVTEYTFAQPATLDKHDELRDILSEKTPVAVEIGALPWRPEVADKSSWTVMVAGGGSSDGASVMEMSSAQWVTDKENPAAAVVNGRGLAEEMGLITGLADLDGGRAWWWLPGLHDATVGVLGPQEIVGFSWVGAERQWVGCTSGGPLTLWLVHDRYRRYMPTASEDASINPWTLTVAEAPWIGRVQFVEVTVKPGWCIGLPAHWGFAVRSEGPERTWWWSAHQHSTLSWLCCNTGRILQHIGPSMSEEED